MIKKISIITALLLMFVSCNNSSSNKKDLNTGKFQEEEIPTCDCTSLITDSLGMAYLDSTLYTGLCFSYYPDSKDKMEERPYLKGQLHGNYLVFDKESQDTISSVKYINGSLENDNLNKNNNCDCKELTRKKEDDKDIWMMKNHRYTGTCYVMNADTTQKIMERSFKNGLVHGDQMIFDNYGEIVQMDQYWKGDLIRTKYFTKD